MEILKILLLIYLLYKDFKFIKLKKYNVKLINVNKNEKEKENNIIAKNPIKDIFFNNNSVIDDFNDFIKEDSIQNNIYKYNILNSPYKNKTKIPIAFGVDNNYIYPLIVLLTSILCNSSPRTFYIFHFMVPPNFSNENKEKIFGLSKKYPQKFEYIFHNMENKYLGWTVFGCYSQAVYYRLSLSDILKDLDKIIYLDCDTIVHKDLTELYNINMGDYCYMGFPGHEIGYVEINGTRNFINSGVMLINLKKLREENAPKLYEDYYRKYGTKKVDEYLINVVFYDKIKFLPFIYGIPDFQKLYIIDSPSFFWNTLNGYCNGTEEEMISADVNRCITHGAYMEIKWWWKRYSSLTHIGRRWFYYAYKSNVFGEICNKYFQFKDKCEKIQKIMNK